MISKILRAKFRRSFRKTDLEIQMAEEQPTDTDIPLKSNIDHADEFQTIKTSYESRLVAAGLRTEAVRAGMIDLDGLKLIDTTNVSLSDRDLIVDGPKIMETLKREKPWLFGGASSSNPLTPPAVQPMRQKTAMEMTAEEYASARSTMVRRRS
jgi:hypothetical protein